MPFVQVKPVSAQEIGCCRITAPEQQMGSLPLCSRVGPAWYSSLSNGLFGKDEENTIWTLGYLTPESHFCLEVNVLPSVQSGAMLVRTDSSFLCPSVTGGPVTRGNALQQEVKSSLSSPAELLATRLWISPSIMLSKVLSLLLIQKIMSGQMKTL